MRDIKKMTEEKVSVSDKLSELSDRCFELFIDLSDVYLTSEDLCELSASVGVNSSIKLSGLYMHSGFVRFYEKPRIRLTKLSKLLNPTLIEKDNYLVEAKTHNEIKENFLKGICLDLDVCLDIASTISTPFNRYHPIIGTP